MDRLPRFQAKKPGSSRNESPSSDSTLPRVGAKVGEHRRARSRRCSSSVDDRGCPPAEFGGSARRLRGHVANSPVCSGSVSVERLARKGSGDSPGEAMPRADRLAHLGAYDCTYDFAAEGARARVSAPAAELIVAHGRAW